MSTSKDYYNQYKTYKEEASNYDKKIKTLTKIKNSLTGDYNDEQNNVNKELNELKSDLNKAIRHDSQFDTIANNCELYKEKSTITDNNLNNAVIALENEIASLDGKKTTAEQKRDSTYKNYETTKEEERQARLDAFKNLF